MTTEHFTALITDHHFRELSPEVVALLEAYLHINPEAQAQAKSIEHTLQLTAQTLEAHPDLIKRCLPAEPKLKKPMPRLWLKTAAVVAILSALTAVYFSPRSSAPSKSPWVHYKIALSPDGQALTAYPVP